jgi:hypothetical protein
MTRTLLLALLLAAPPQEDGYDPVINPADFVDEIDNPYLPLEPGTRRVYESLTDEGLERTVVFVTHKKKTILGVKCTVVRDTVTLDGELIEDTYDWFAQHKDGTVWYFGEFSTEYEDGVAVSTEGSWEAGVDGAKPGRVMLGNPKVGKKYRQEYYAGVAEDMARVLSLDEEVEVPYGEFEDCLKTRDWTPLEPGVYEHKYYAKGVGLVLEVNPFTGRRTELVEFDD